MHAASVVALGYRYPTPTSLDTLNVAVRSSLQGGARRHMESFMTEVGRLVLGEWEELHTRTLDLNPMFVPYIGHVEWGENYRRGEFMADLKRDMDLLGVDLGGELPDHIEPILRYVAEAPVPLGDLMEVLASSVSTMKKTLTKESSDNPYLHVLAATASVVEDLRPLEIGTKR